jgi:pimeloyl-ACP methyl ester carboxylesterase
MHSRRILSFVALALLVAGLIAVINAAPAAAVAVGWNAQPPQRSLNVPTLGGVGDGGEGGSQGAASQLSWKRCRGGVAQCTKIAVPLDDTVLDSPTLDLALVRIPARDPDRRIGSLLINPGGPGAPATDFTVDFASSLPSEIQDRFDLVGFDPRGVGASEGVDCTDDLDPFYALDWTPDTEAGRTALEVGVRKIVDACVQSDGDILPFLGTDRAARDMDLIRAALGDDKLTYLGYSYGTYLGAQYAAQFPDRVRALVLDGPVDPALDATAVQVQQAVAFERSLNLFLRDCARKPGCAFHHGGDSARAYDALRARIDAAPIPASHAGRGRTLNTTLFDIGVTELLYSGEETWSILADLLVAAENGDGSDLVTEADVYTGRSRDGTYDDLQEAFFAVGCVDGPAVGGVGGLRAIEEAAARVAPRLGRSVVNNSLACAFWPVEAQPPAPLHAPTSPPLLVLGTRDDPATPLRWAKGLTEELESAVLVTVGGARHTAFASGNQCVDDVVVHYLVDDAVPKSGKRC